MTISRNVGYVPEWTLADRLRKARSLTGLNSKDFAAELGVSQATVTNAENGHHSVRRITLNAWALATGVDRRWLETGKAPVSGPDEGDECAVRDSNPEPADLGYWRARRGQRRAA